MKLGEKSARRGGRMRSVDTLPRRLEDELDFDARNQLTEQDWEVLTNVVKVRWETKRNIFTCVELLMAAQYLDPQQFHSLINSAEFKPTFIHMSSPDHPHLLQGLPAGKDVVTTLMYRLAIQDVFPQHDEGRVQEVEKKFLRENINVIHLQTLAVGKDVETLYVMKRLHLPEASRVEVQIRDFEFEEFKKLWQETWGVGHLEDVMPDKLVKKLAMIRIIDPNLFRQIPLDKKFWDLARGWIQELRDSIGREDVNDIFQFVFNLSILAAEGVRVLPDGKLEIRPKKTTMEQHAPLPVREAI